MRTGVAGAALVGGLCWMGAAWFGALAWVGAVLLAVAALGAGASLVSRSVAWLRAVVAVCFLALVASVLEVFRQNVDGDLVLLLAGVVAFVAGAVGLARRPTVSSPTGGVHVA